MNISGCVVGFGEGLVGAKVQVKGDIQKIDHLEVDFNGDAQLVSLEDILDLLDDLGLVGARRQPADAQPVVPEEAEVEPPHVLHLVQDEEPDQVAQLTGLLKTN